MKKFLCLAMLVGSVLAASSLIALEAKMVGGSEMYPSKNIVANVTASADHTTLVTAVKAAGLVDTLEGKGPFTVFAPSNEAFAKLPAGTMDSLLKPENKTELTKVITYHVIAGKLDAKDLGKMIKTGNGTAKLTTVEGETLNVTMKGDKVTLQGVKGDPSTVTISDVYQSNGVIHVVDTVVLPN
jgi:uncharacterized surface protein with fasciclin (FAS1) repeats